MMDFNTVLQILDSAVRLMTPLLLACLAGLYSERSGVFDIGLEGKMLMAAFTAASVERSRSVSSIRSKNRPPDPYSAWCLANSQLYNAVRVPPM
mgnify:CR=1 FL=1